MIKVTFETKGKTFKDLIIDIDEMDKLVQLEINKLAPQAQEKMQSIIKQSKKRPQAGETPNLAEAIDVVYYDNGWGVASIGKLDSEAVYWRAINYGSHHMVGKKMPGARFSPGEPKANSDNFREGRLKPQSKGGQGKGIPVSNPIPPMNFIQKTVNYVEQRLNDIVLIFRRRT